MSPADRAVIETTIGHLEEKLKKEHAPPLVKRDAHPKMHGCVQGELIVDGGVDQKLRHGVFASRRTYRAWVRFSNAFGELHDLKGEPRGIAMKLLDVNGEHVNAFDGENATQDFLLVTHDAFFLPNPSEYVQFVQAVKDGSIEVAKFFLSRPWRWRGGIALYRSKSVPTRSPLAVSYFSQTPYRLGPDLTIKLQMRPVMTPELRRALPGRVQFRLKKLAVGILLSLSKLRIGRPLLKVAGCGGSYAEVEDFCHRRIASRDTLRHGLMAYLASHDAWFDLLVQCFVNDSVTPVEDATRRWRPLFARFHKVATLRIPRQVFWPEPGMPREVEEATSRMMDLGESMSFNPWHALKAHEPRGRINLSRRPVYHAIVGHRRGENRVSTPAIVSSQVELYDRLRETVQGIVRRGLAKTP
jgi:hypothetical protein